MCTDKIQQCKDDINALQEKLKELRKQSEPKIGDCYQHKYDKNIRMICRCKGELYFVTIENFDCSFPDHFPLGESYLFSYEKEDIIDGTSVWKKVN